MFRPMRRFKQELSREHCEQILKDGTYGVLAVAGDDNYPYTVPLCYLWMDGKIYFHCAKSGHKNDAIARNPKVSFCVVDSDEIVPEEYTSYFRSVVVFGRANVVTDDGERFRIMDEMARRFHPTDTQENRHMKINKQFNPMQIVAVEVDHISGKEAIELVKRRGNNT